jgi:ATP-binding cassette, subfamily B, multidrug efflux pump
MKHPPQEKQTASSNREMSAGKGRPSGSILPIVKRLFTYIRPYSKHVTATIGAALLTTIIELSPPWVIRFAVDRFITAGNIQWVWYSAIGLLLIAFVQGGFDFLRLYLTAYTGQRIVFKIRNAVFGHINRLSFSYFDEASTGDLMSRVTSDVDILNNFFGRAVVIVFTNILTLTGILIVLLIWNWRIALIYMALIPLIILGMWAYARKVRPAWKRVQQQLAKLTATLQETFTGVMVVKVLGREDYEQKRMTAKSSKVLKAHLETSRITSFWMPFADVIIGVGTGLILFVGGRNVIANQLSLGMLIGFTTYLTMLLRPIRQTGMMLNVVMQSMAAAERVFEILDTQPEIQDVPAAVPLMDITGRVRFETVSFAYEQDGRGVQALHQVSFQAEPGTLIALVGPSGAGKSTLVHLLSRFYEPQKGRILIDGQDIAQVTFKSLQQSIGMAFQSVFLFDASIAENIAFGNPEVNQSEIKKAAKIVQIHDFIESLPLGYNTPVGERGVRLSGGQKQRIALARVLITDPQILILDEPTSSLDAETEIKLKKALDNVLEGRTTFMIAHRLWTVEKADQILVLDNGRIVEQARTTSQGSAHAALLDQNGLYARLHQSQFQLRNHETIPSHDAGGTL